MADWDCGAVPAGDEPAQQPILRARVLLYRLWLGGMPALLKGLSRAGGAPRIRPRQAGRAGPTRQAPRRPFGAGCRDDGDVGAGLSLVLSCASLKALERNILGFVGFGPIHETLVASVEGQSDDARQQWLGKLAALGRRTA
jgi:hypothetical protein